MVTTRLTRLGQPFTRRSLPKLVAYLRKVHGRAIRIGREALRGLLARRLPPHPRGALLPPLLLGR